MSLYDITALMAKTHTSADTHTHTQGYPGTLYSLLLSVEEL
jgi:hypothetical protein